MSRPRRAAQSAQHPTASLFVVLVLALPVVAAADTRLVLEAGVAVPLSAPQSNVYDVGGSQSLRLLFGVTSFLDVGPAVSFVLLPAALSGAESGIGWGLGGGARLARPRDAESFLGVLPWLDADLLYMKTGELSRPAFDVAVGLAVPLGRTRAFWVGPYVRYLHILQADDDTLDNRDAKLLSFGVSLEVGGGAEVAHVHEDTRQDAPPSASASSPVVVCAPTTCPDKDDDGILDRVDRCPDVVGTAETFGCPTYQKLVIRRDKLELKDKLYFQFDRATLDPASFPVLDETAEALKANTAFKVQIDGHSDSTGGEAHNQTLSEQRAQAVRDYLVARGVSESRLTWKGFSSSVPVDTNQTSAGRENNRRVDFVVTFIILDDAERAQ